MVGVVECINQRRILVAGGAEVALRRTGATQALWNDFDAVLAHKLLVSFNHSLPLRQLPYSTRDAIFGVVGCGQVRLVQASQEVDA